MTQTKRKPFPWILAFFVVIAIIGLIAALLKSIQEKSEPAEDPGRADSIQGALIQKDSSQTLRQGEKSSASVTEPSHPGTNAALRRPAQTGSQKQREKPAGPARPDADADAAALISTASNQFKANPQAALRRVDTPDVEQIGEYKVVGFNLLSSFEYDLPENTLTAPNVASHPEDSEPNDRIPKPVREYDEQQVALKGFMLPLKVQNGLVTELLLMRDQSMCCYGTVPKINEWVSVKMNEVGVKPIMDQPVTMFGKLHVGEIRDKGYLLGIYRMEGERMAGPLDL